MTRFTNRLLAQPAGQFEPAARAQRRVDPVETRGKGSPENLIRRHAHRPKKLRSSGELQQSDSERGIAVDGRMTNRQGNAANLSRCPGGGFSGSVRLRKAEHHSPAR